MSLELVIAAVAEAPATTEGMDVPPVPPTGELDLPKAAVTAVEPTLPMDEDEGWDSAPVRLIRQVRDLLLIIERDVRMAEHRQLPPAVTQMRYQMPAVFDETEEMGALELLSETVQKSLRMAYTDAIKFNDYADRYARSTNQERILGYDAEALRNLAPGAYDHMKAAEAALALVLHVHDQVGAKDVG